MHNGGSTEHELTVEQLHNRFAPRLAAAQRIARACSQLSQPGSIIHRRSLAKILGWRSVSALGSWLTDIYAMERRWEIKPWAESW
jgi:hypothetical protein